MVVLALAVWVFYIYQITAPVNSRGQAEKVLFAVEEGKGVKQIARALEEQHFIRSQFWLETYVWLKHLERNFVAGQHELSYGLNLKEIVAILTTPGGSEDEITIIEGWNNQEIAAYLKKQNLAETEQFLKDAKNGPGLGWQNEFAFLQDKPAYSSLEGYLFPDTYRIFKNSTSEEIIRKMLTNFGQKLTPDLRAEIARQNKTIFDVIIVASILEKEVRTPEDMKMVADIFYKRLKVGQGLESDATVNYITGSGRNRSTAEDLKIDSPYNTYKYAGLPPGPISNPGLNAILAAIYPTSNVYYYFLTTAGGTVIYSKDYNEHLLNTRKYLNP